MGFCRFRLTIVSLSYVYWANSFYFGVDQRRYVQLDRGAVGVLKNNYDLDKTRIPPFTNCMSKNDINGEEVNSPRFRTKVKKLAKNILIQPISTVAPQAIAEILTDATTGAIEVTKETLDEIRAGGTIRSSKAFSRILEEEAEMQGSTAEALDTIAL